MLLARAFLRKNKSRPPGTKQKIWEMCSDERRRLKACLVLKRRCAIFLLPKLPRAVQDSESLDANGLSMR